MKVRETYLTKERVLELITIFGLDIELDRWEEKGWILVVSTQYKDNFMPDNRNCLIIFDDTSEIEVLDKLRESLIIVGKSIQLSTIKQALKII